MKRLLIVLFLFTTYSLKAQHDPKDQIISDNWDVVGSVELKVKDGNTTLPIFNNNIKKYANKPFELEGYIVPIKDGMKQSKFMLSTLPINQCYFCGKNGVPIMVLVELVEPIKFSYQTVTIKGTLKLNAGNALDTPPVALVNGKSI